MANRTTFVEVSDGDQLSEGYFNEIGGIYLEASDTSGTDFTQVSSGTPIINLARTFVFTTPESSYRLRSIYARDISFSQDNSAILVMDITDGTDTYTLKYDGASPPEFLSGAATTNSTTGFISGTGYYDATPAIMVPYNLFAATTSHTIRLYVYTGNPGTGVLYEGYTLGCDYVRAATTKGSVSQS